MLHDSLGRLLVQLVARDRATCVHTYEVRAETAEGVAMAPAATTPVEVTAARYGRDVPGMGVPDVVALQPDQPRVRFTVRPWAADGCPVHLLVRAPSWPEVQPGCDRADVPVAFGPRGDTTPDEEKDRIVRDAQAALWTRGAQPKCGLELTPSAK